MLKSSTAGPASSAAPQDGPVQLRTVDVIVAGHICLDIIPGLNRNQRRPEDLFVPGGLVHIGPATLALGGCVANTGQALHRLGAKTRLVGKVGDDLLGKTILESLRSQDAALPEAMVVTPGEATSYTIVFSPPGVDRCFLHCSGANDTFVAADLQAAVFEQARILHFGYPPLMRSIAADAGRSLAGRFAAAQAAGLLVTLDMAMPAAGSDASPVDWHQWLANVLPHIDVFLPSYDELGALLPGLVPAKASRSGIDVKLLASMAQELISLGAPVVVVKLGDQGLYLRMSEGVSKLSHRAAWSEFDWTSWRGRELMAPCFEVNVVGTTGSGDCTIAGFLMALLQGASPGYALRLATAVGAHSVESSDATSGIPAFSQVDSRLQSDWRRLAPSSVWAGWKYQSQHGVYTAP